MKRVHQPKSGEFKLDIYDPEHFAIATSTEIRTVWECLRHMGPRTTLAELSQEMEWPIARIAPSLDRLIGVGLVSRSRASRASRAVRYTVTTDRFVVVINPADPRTKDAFAAADPILTNDFMKLLPNLCRAGRTKKGDATNNTLVIVSLDMDDVTELCRRVAHVADFLEMHAQRPQRTPKRTIQRCNYAVLLRFAPLVEEMLPQAAVNVHAVNVNPQCDRSYPAVRRTLSDREILVARYLQDGYSRADISAKLKLSLSTVHTYCKRLFKKLNITRAADLQRISLHPRQDRYAVRTARLNAPTDGATAARGPSGP